MQLRLSNIFLLFILLVGFNGTMLAQVRFTATISPTAVTVDGKILQSNPVRLKVVNEPTGNSANRNSPFSGLLQLDEPQPENNFSDFILKKGDNVPDKINKNIFVKTGASKTSCFVGEPVVVTYKLYTRLKSESNIIKHPSFNGFSVIDLMTDPNINYVAEKLNGRDYNVYTIRKAQLYPLQAGAMELETASVENDIHFIKDAYIKSTQQADMFGNRIAAALPAAAFVDEKITLQSKPVTIIVKPLPEADKPVSFNGAVGNFTIDAAVEKNNFTTDDAGKLRIVLSGQGNLPLMNAPEFVWPSGIEAFEPTAKDDLNKQAVPVSGIKTFDYAFNITKEGSYTLPAVEYSFFDATAGKYKTISTKPISIHVTKGSGKKMLLPATTDNRVTRESFFETLFTKRWLIILPVALLILTGLFFWLKSETAKEKKIASADIKETWEEKNKRETVFPKNPLLQTEAMLVKNDARQFYEALNKELHIFLADKLQLGAEKMNKKNIGESLDRKGVSVADSIAIQQLLDDISMQLYTPFANEGRIPYFYEQALTAVNSFNKRGS